MRDFKADDAAAAKVLDTALARHDQEASLEYGLALAARVELAVAMDEPEQARALYAQWKALPLSDDERQTLRREIPALNRLERSSTPIDNVS